MKEIFALITLFCLAIIPEASFGQTNISIGKVAGVDPGYRTYVSTGVTRGSTSVNGETGAGIMGLTQTNIAQALGEGDGKYFPLKKDLQGGSYTNTAISSKYLTDGSNYLQPKFAAISASASGDNTLIAAVTAKKIRILSYTIVTSGAVVVRFESGAGGTALTGQMPFAANGGASVSCAPMGCFETAAATLLNLELGDAVGVSGHLVYVEVP